MSDNHDWKVFSIIRCIPPVIAVSIRNRYQAKEIESNVYLDNQQNAVIDAKCRGNFS